MAGPTKERLVLRTYLVTGCAGFIGWKVSELLLQKGSQVIGVDNLNDAYDPILKQWRLSQLKEHPRFTFHHLDITQKDGLDALFQKPLDGVINLAARAGVRYSVVDPWVYYDTNVTGTLNLLELCRKYGVKKFILASTSSLYGNAKTVPFHEDLNTSTPISPYAASKKAAETLCYTYHYLYGLDITVFRYFTVYGPAGRPDMSLFRFTQWVAEGKSVKIFGDGSQSRDFTYVDDIARGTLLGLKPLGFCIINLGSDTPHGLMEALAFVEESLQKKAKVVYAPAHPSDVPRTWADISRARKLLGWEPKVTLKEGIEQLVAWYQRERGWAKDVSTED